eukprot:m.81111 g.81111  ORF g.81111 m.81111 type:complete len:140 (+) comp14236_c1_seq3:35-454(+)
MLLFFSHLPFALPIPFSFIISEAAERSKYAGHRVLTCEHVLEALQELCFDHYVEPLQRYTEACRRVLNVSKRAVQRRSAQASSRAATATTTTSVHGTEQATPTQCFLPSLRSLQAHMPAAPSTRTNSTSSDRTSSRNSA